MKRLGKRLSLGVFVLAAATAAAPACTNSGSGTNTSTKPKPKTEAPTADLSVSVVFPSDADKTKTASVHVWALAPKATAVDATCSALVGGALDPYDQSLERHADVATAPDSLPAQASKVLLGPVLIYAEAVAFDGKTPLAGCVPAVEVVQPSTSATVTLTKAGVYDCSDPTTKDGVPCDDGKSCTIGEKCSGGACKGGVARDCSYLADECNAGTCDDAKGCIATPLPDKTPCDDSLYCTTGDVCTKGVCAGTPRDCSLNTPPCQVSLGCSETYQQCQYQDAPSGTTCDDGKYCTVNDQCDYYGSCYGSTRDCSAVADQCNNASCDETQGKCVPVPKSTAYSCNDNLACTSSDHCDGLGACSGTPKNCTSLDDQCNTGTCTEPSAVCVKTPKADGTACDDGNAATTNDHCTAGVCAGT